MTLADQLRDFVERHFLPGSPRGYNLLELADQIEELENAPPRGSSVTAPENETP